MVLTYDPKDVVLLKNGLRVTRRKLVNFNELSFQKRTKKKCTTTTSRKQSSKVLFSSVNNDQ